MKKKIIINGGGICGLTTAIAIQDFFDIEIYEAASEFKTVGAGLVLSSNALKALQAIGIVEDVIKAGNIIDRFYIKSAEGTKLSEVNSQKLGTGVGEVGTVAIHRAELHQVLLSRLNKNVRLFTNKKATAFEKKDKTVTVQFQDGNTATGDYLLACDGIHSPIRRQLLPDSTIRYAGYTCWRGVLNHNLKDLNTSIATETWGKEGRFGVVPLTNNRIYWFACINSKTAKNRLFEAFKIEHLQENFEKYHFPIPQSLNLTTQNDVFWDDITDLQPLKQLAFDNILLMGDAGHATTPNMGQGACQAIEDAVVLRNCIRQFSTDSSEKIERSFKAFENKRLPRTTKIVNTSWTFGKAAQFTNSVAISLRNFAVKMTPESVAAKQASFLNDVTF